MLIFFFPKFKQIPRNKCDFVRIESKRQISKKSCCFATTSQIIVHACKIAFATSKFNGEMVKNKDRVDNQTCTVVENWQEKSHF